MKKKILSALLVMLAVFMTACSGGTSSAANVTALKGPTGMGMVKLIDEASESYNFTLSSAPDEVTAEIIKGTVDIAAVPANLAAVLYKKTEGQIQIAAINTLGVLYVLENGNTVNSVSDLKGKTIYATGQASTPEYVLRYILAQNGIDPDNDVEIVYKTEHSELATLMASGEVAIGMMPEPNVTAAMNQNPDLRIALDLTAEWDKVSDGKLIQGAIVVNKTFAEKNKKAVNKFLDEYKASVEYVNSNMEEASQLIEKHGIVAKAALALKALPNCNIVYIDGEEMKNDINGFYKVLFEADAKSVGGALPDEAFFYSR